MNDAITLVWVGFIFVGAIFFAVISIIYLFQKNNTWFDKNFFLSLSACLVGLTVCLYIWPPYFHVYQDEFAFISQSANLLLSGKASVTLKGSFFHPEAFAAWTSNSKLPGFAWLETVIFFLTQDFFHSYFVLNIVLGTLSVAVVYRIAWLWTASREVAWWSAIFMACLPARISYSMSAASDIAGSFFFLLFILFLKEFRGQRLKRILYAALFCGIYSICIKPVYGIFVIFGLVMSLYIYRRHDLLDKKLYHQILIDAFCLFLPIMVAIPIFLSFNAKQGDYSFSFVFKNIYTSIIYLFNFKQNTFLTTLVVMAAVGRSIFYKNDSLVNRLAGWFLMGLLTFSVFLSGGITYPGRVYSDRYFLIFSFPFVFLAGLGMVDIVLKRYPRLMGVLFFTMLIVNALFASNHLVKEARNNFYYKKTLLLNRVVQLVPHEAYIIDECAAFVISITSRKSIQTELFVKGDYPKQVVFLKGMPDDLYEPEDVKRMVLVENILDSTYRCKPLVPAPLKERDLSVTPLLCTRTQ